MNKRISVLLQSILLCAAGFVSRAEAYGQPSVNLGFTSFLDGAPPAGAGWYVADYLQYYSADRFLDADGREIPFPDPCLNVWVNLLQVLYQSDREVLKGARWGLDVIVPLVRLDLDYDVSGPFPSDNGSGMGDLLVGPYLQWDPLMGRDGPVLMNRVEFQLIFPTGKYDADHELNPGSNVFSFNPYWSTTWFFSPRWSFSARLHYLWNDTNDDPVSSSGALEDTRAGQAFHANLALAWEALPGKLRAGLNGYYLNQFTDDEADGEDVADSREKVLGVGIGAIYSFSREDHLFVNLFFETETENRTEGDRITLLYVHHFS
jgi:hypothetical protein